MATCRAGVFPGDGTFQVREFEIPEVPSGGALARVEAVGLCGSDVAQLHGIRNVPGAVFPVVPGHEIVARIVDIDHQFDLGVVEGDRVAIDEVLSVEPLRVYGATDMVGRGETGLWGGYGEFIQLFAGTKLHRFETDAPSQRLTVFEPLANAVNWVDSVEVGPDDVAVVLGPGHQGLAVIEALRIAGVTTVVVVGTASDGLRLRAASALGAAYVFDASATDVISAIKDLTGGAMADIVFEVTPAPAAVQVALELVRMGGQVLLAGLKEGKRVDGLLTDLVPLRGLRIVGGLAYTPASMAKAVDLINRGEVRLDVLAGESFSLDDLDAALALLTRQATGRDAVRVSLVHRKVGQ